MLTYHGGRDGPNFRLLLHQLREGKVDKVAFVKPAGASWPLPLYDLALMTAADCAAHDRSGVELSLITPEEEPLGIFGNTASVAIRRLLAESGVTLHTSSYGVPSLPDGWTSPLAIGPSRLTESSPNLGWSARRLRGIPSGRDGFIDTDAHGRVPGLDDVFAAGDATTFPVKQGGLAAQQADAVAEAIAASVGADIDPQPFRPVLRGVLLTGGRGALSARGHQRRAGDDSIVSGEALWWPPNKLCRALPRALPQQPDRRGQRRHAPRRARDPRRDRPRAGGAGQAEQLRRALRLTAAPRAVPPR